MARGLLSGPGQKDSSEASKLTISNNMPPTSCIRLVPAHQATSTSSSSSHHDPFINAPAPMTATTTVYHPSKQARPVLRPSLSHNGVYHHPTAYPRATMHTKASAPGVSSQSHMQTQTHSQTSTAVETPRPATAGPIYDHASTTPLPPVSSAAEQTTFFSAAPPPSTSVSVVPAHNPSFTSHSHPAASTATATTTPPSSATIPAYTQHPPHPHPHSQPISIQHTTPTYADEHSFGTSYSYDTSFSSTSSGSPWMGQHAAPHPPPALVPSQYYPHPHVLYEMYGPVKQVEPILAPGEIPAPRPPMSYAALIGEALLLAPPPHHLYVSEISESIKKRYACEYGSVLSSKIARCRCSVAECLLSPASSPPPR